MKKTLIVAATLLSFCTFTANAQTDRESNEYKREALMQTEKMAKELNLNDEQKSVVMQINIRNAQHKNAPEADQKRFQQDMDKRLQTVLSADQYKKYIATKKKEGATTDKK